MAVGMVCMLAGMALDMAVHMVERRQAGMVLDMVEDMEVHMVVGTLVCMAQHMALVRKVVDILVCKVLRKQACMEVDM